MSVFAKKFIRFVFSYKNTIILNSQFSILDFYAKNLFAGINDALGVEELLVEEVADAVDVTTYSGEPQLLGQISTFKHQHTIGE